MKRPSTRVEVAQLNKAGKTYRKHYIGTFKHPRVARVVEQQASDLLAARDMDAFAELMDRYVKNRTNENGSGAQVA